MNGRWEAPKTSLTLMAVSALLLSGCWFEVEEDETDIQSSIRTMLSRSASEWNGGDLDGFMDDYLHSETITLIGSSGLVTGYDSIRARYSPRFEPGVDRDSLRFEDVATRRLDGVHGMVTGRWTLYRNGSTTASGPFTLIVRRTSSGWKIIHDHSSSDAPPPPVGE
jgi:ketosteroid isomerase-like protein